MFRSRHTQHSRQRSQPRSMCRRGPGRGQLGGQHHEVGAVGQQGHVAGVLAPAESASWGPGSPGGGQACRGSRRQARYDRAWHKPCGNLLYASCAPQGLHTDALGLEVAYGCNQAQQPLAESMATWACMHLRLAWRHLHLCIRREHQVVQRRGVILLLVSCERSGSRTPALPSAQFGAARPGQCSAALRAGDGSYHCKLWSHWLQGLKTSLCFPQMPRHTTCQPLPALGRSKRAPKPQRGRRRWWRTTPRSAHTQRQRCADSPMHALACRCTQGAACAPVRRMSSRQSQPVRFAAGFRECRELGRGNAQHWADILYRPVLTDLQATPLPQPKVDVGESQDSAAKSIATAKREVSRTHLECTIGGLAPSTMPCICKYSCPNCLVPAECWMYQRLH